MQQTITFLKNILEVDGVNSILDQHFLTVNKKEDKKWDDIKHIIIALLNEHYGEGKNNNESKNFEDKIIITRKLKNR